MLPVDDELPQTIPSHHNASEIDLSDDVHPDLKQCVSPMAERAKTVADWPVPTFGKELQSFLGLANFYRWFVPSFADISSPLTLLTRTKLPSIGHRKAFDNLKHVHVSPPILDYPKQTDNFVLTKDASYVGLGAVLLISQGTVVEYASRSLTSVERNYTTIEKECLAIV